jgi:hypothetical protein
MAGDAATIAVPPTTARDATPIARDLQEPPHFQMEMSPTPAALDLMLPSVLAARMRQSKGRPALPADRPAIDF